MPVSFIQKYIEDYGLEFRKGANKFFEVMEKSDEENWTPGQFFETLEEAFPEKKGTKVLYKLVCNRGVLILKTLLKQ